MEPQDWNFYRNIEQATLELRLAEQSFFRDVVGDLRRRYRKQIFWTMVATIWGAAFMWGILICPLLHRFNRCPWV